MQTYDIAIVGAGPAGLSAALYSARFCRSTLVLHDGQPRAARIPRTYNAPGFDTGVAGGELIERMTRHAHGFGAIFQEARVVDVHNEGNEFVLADESGTQWRARAVILATGINLNQIPIDHDVHEAAIEMGVLRYCPVCDGYEHRGKRIGVVGCDISGAAEALFLRQFSDNVTLLPMANVELTASERKDLSVAGVRTFVEPIVRYEPREDAMHVYLAGRPEPHSFDVLYPALGVTPRSELAAMVGLELTDKGKIGPEAPYGTAIPGVFGAGDLVEGLDQISVAMGHGSVAATRAHNWLRDRDGETVAAVIGG